MTTRELLVLLQTLAADPEFEPSLDHFMDVTEIERFNADPTELRTLADTSPFGPSSRRAVVVNEDYIFGLARMYEVFVEQSGGRLQAFRDPSDARDWLGLNEDER